MNDFTALKGLSVIDCHAHFPVSWGQRQVNSIVAGYNHERDERMHLEWDFPERQPGPQTDDEIEKTARLWDAEISRYGLRKVVFMTGGGNDRLAAIVRKYPDSFLGFAHHHLEQDDALDEMVRAREELGMVGLKLIAPRFSIPFEDPSLRPVWRYLADNRIPVLIHFGLLGRGGGIVYHPRIDPLTLYPVAREYAEIPFIIPHFGCGYVRELLHLCWSCPNVHVDTSGSNGWMRWQPYPLTLEDLFRKFYETVGPERIVFGTDSSWLPRGFVYRYLQDHLRACRQLAFKEDDIRLIFGGNAARLLGMK